MKNNIMDHPEKIIKVMLFFNIIILIITLFYQKFMLSRITLIVNIILCVTFIIVKKYSTFFTF